MAKVINKKSQRPKKEVTLAEIKEKIARSKSMVVTDYRGLSMTKLSELRMILGETGEFSVTKNTILARALNEAGMADINPDTFQGPSAVLFSYDDEVGPLKVLTKFATTAGDLPAIKCGILEMVVLSGDRVKALSKLPGKQEMRGQVVGTLAAPLTGLVTVLNGNIRNLVYALNEVQKQKAANA
ncbi:MAG: 50S ribosomal protein L10 [bacterium]|nr:50S ribosomal protein L10 [bacterium]